MPRPRNLASFPSLYWALFERALAEGRLDLDWPPNDRSRFTMDLRSFIASLRKAGHPDADRYSGVQVWCPKGDPGRITFQPRDLDPRLEPLRRQIGGGMESPPVARADRERTSPSGEPTTSSLDDALAHLFSQDNHEENR